MEEINEILENIICMYDVIVNESISDEAKCDLIVYLNSVYYEDLRKIKAKKHLIENKSLFIKYEHIESIISKENDYEYTKDEQDIIKEDQKNVLLKLLVNTFKAKGDFEKSAARTALLEKRNKYLKVYRQLYASGKYKKYVFDEHSLKESDVKFNETVKKIAKLIIKTPRESKEDCENLLYQINKLYGFHLSKISRIDDNLIYFVHDAGLMKSYLIISKFVSKFEKLGIEQANIHPLKMVEDLYPVYKPLILDYLNSYDKSLSFVANSHSHSLSELRKVVYYLREFDEELYIKYVEKSKHPLKRLVAQLKVLEENLSLKKYSPIEFYNSLPNSIRLSFPGNLFAIINSLNKHKFENISNYMIANFNYSYTYDESNIHYLYYLTYTVEEKEATHEDKVAAKELLDTFEIPLADVFYLDALRYVMTRKIGIKERGKNEI